MTGTDPAPPVGAHPPATAEAWQAGRLTALSLAQLVSWGILFYALIVAAPAISDDTGWPLALVTALFSLGLIASAILGVPVGRILDRGPRSAMTAGSIAGAVGLVIVALAPDPVMFGIGWLVAGAAQSAVLYQAAFTVLDHRYRRHRRGAMTVLTLAGGLASTVFAPIVAALLTVTDWRTTFLVLAGVLAAVTAPVHWLTLEIRWPPAPPSAPEDEPPAALRAVLLSRRCWALEISTLLLAASLYTVTLAAIPLFLEKGMTYTLAAWGLGLLGAGQVIGRLIYVALPHGAPPWIALTVTSALAALALLLLVAEPGPAWLLIGIGVAAGAVRGAQTLVQGSAVAERWGTRDYGAINGVFATPITIVAALGPTLGPVAATAAGGYGAVAIAAAGVALLGALIARWS